MPEYLNNRNVVEEEVRQINEHVITCPCCGGDRLYGYPYPKPNGEQLFYCCDCNIEFKVVKTPVISSFFKTGGSK